MTSSVRIDDDLIKDAEDQGKICSRTMPKQIELWAQIGKKIELNMTPLDLAALIAGNLEVKLVRKKSLPVSMDSVLANIEADRATGALHAKVVQGNIWYEDSKTTPGVLIRRGPSREDLGKFVNGKFKVIKKNQPAKSHKK